MATNKEKKMLTREECEKACMYLLKHCYETDAPALDDGEEGKTYTFTPSGFLECEIFKNLIEEHFNHKPLQFKEIKKYTWIWDNKYKNYIRVDLPFIDETNNRKIIKFKTIDFNGYCKFEENRFYSVTIPTIEGEDKC
jgi:hypothetical protein